VQYQGLRHSNSTLWCTTAIAAIVCVLVLCFYCPDALCLSQVACPHEAEFLSYYLILSCSTFGSFRASPGNMVRLLNQMSEDVLVSRGCVCECGGGVGGGGTGGNIPAGAGWCGEAWFKSGEAVAR
jgi:hypothetical protein